MPMHACMGHAHAHFQVQAWRPRAGQATQNEPHTPRTHQAKPAAAAAGKKGAVVRDLDAEEDAGAAAAKLAELTVADKVGKKWVGRVR